MCYDYEKMSVHSCKQYILVYDHTITDTHCTCVHQTAWHYVIMYFNHFYSTGMYMPNYTSYGC